MENPDEYVSKTNLKLSELIDPLESILSNVEPNFLQLGQELQTIHNDSEKLAGLSVSAAQSIGGESEQSSLTSIGEFAKDSLSRLETCRSEVTGSLDNVLKVVQHLEKLQSLCPVIKTIAKTLNIIALNIAMESSRTRRGEEMFSFFATIGKAV